MSTVRCPSCHRALNLPETREVEAAQCPLCRATFPVHVTPIPTVSSLPPLVERIPPFRPRETPAPADPLRFDEPESPDRKLNRRACESAAGWLKMTGVLGLTQILLCGCCEGVDAGMKPGIENFQFVLFFLLLRGVALAVVWSAAESFRKYRSPELVRLGAVFAALLGLYMLYRSRIGWIHLVELAMPGPAARPPNETVALTVYGLFFAVVGVVGFVGAVKTLLLLSRPAVRELFNR